MNKLSYTKTNWIDGKTIVDASKLNKIENAIGDLYNNALGTDDLKEGPGIKIEGKTIEIGEEVMTSDSCTGIEWNIGEPEDGYDPKKLYFILGENKTLEKIVLGGITIFQV